MRPKSPSTSGRKNGYSIDAIVVIARSTTTIHRVKSQPLTDWHIAFLRTSLLYKRLIFRLIDIGKDCTSMR
ncbi:hypothetical protein H5410_038131 [Solanum commersonii]|uniref:Uncharacterized protein n=1 Tax=Solanum commersonii TaxID=4109 RepID=A0A9J5Y856_SOLCO|nr:hypothetical protein H5410_038131 [Solanum commersonii]